MNQAPKTQKQARARTHTSNYNIECYWLISKLQLIQLSDNKLTNNKLSKNKMSNNNLASELVENMSFFKPITMEKIVNFTKKTINHCRLYNNPSYSRILIDSRL